MLCRLFIAVLVCAASFAARAQERVLDGFESFEGWSVVTADGVTLTMALEPGKSGSSLRLDYDFTRGSGYGIVRKEFGLALPDNYRFRYAFRGQGPDNTIEFKLIDRSGDNVWWVNQRSVRFPADWKTVSLKRRHFSFAWGPAGADKPLDEMRYLEIAITSTSGGKGTVWLDELTFEPLPPTREYRGTPNITASSSETGDVRPALSRLGDLRWTSAKGDAAPTLTVDFGESREFGGLVLGWGNSGFGVDYTVAASNDGLEWSDLKQVTGSNGAKDSLWLPESDARYLRMIVHRKTGSSGVSLGRFQVMPLSFGNSHNALMGSIAADTQRGRYPKYFRGEATYWTVVGVDGDENEALINEEGVIETDRLSCSIEPFVYSGAKLHTWADARITRGLRDGYLPMPWVRWELGGLSLRIDAFADGDPGRSTLWVRYELTNTGEIASDGVLFLAARPFQVLPPYQNLNITGGSARVESLERVERGVLVNGSRSLVPISRAAGFGAARFESGDITDYLERGELPQAGAVQDRDGLASGAFSYPFALEPGKSSVVWIAAPFHKESPEPMPEGKDANAAIEARLAGTASLWREKLNRVKLSLPAEAAGLWDIARSNLAYVLINRDGPSVQPGSRNYERTWIRDGSLTSAAMLSFGHTQEVREFVDWFAPFQYADGKIPCCADKRGPDPVPEHDSHGQYIFAVLNYEQFTQDTSFLERHWPRVQSAAAYIEKLRAQRMTEEYRSGSPEKRAMYGLLPESISHEGYSAKPMHSYWDDLFALKGLKDAVTIAETLGHAGEAARLAALRDSFRETLVESLRLVIEQKGIDYIPGCAELGDFDATSTTVALFPCGELGSLPEPQLRNTFERYWKFCQDRIAGGAWEGYTPYETRAIGAFIRLGWRDRAHELLEFFRGHQRPAEWNHWAEVVWRDPGRQGFVGDMPHTWVGSDFLNSFRSVFVYECDTDGALVLLAGVPEAWLRSREGLAVSGWPTHFGTLSYRVANSDGQPVLTIDPGIDVPPSGLVVEPPTPAKIKRAIVNGQEVALGASGALTLRELPATIRFDYAD